MKLGNKKSTGKNGKGQAQSAEAQELPLSRVPLIQTVAVLVGALMVSWLFLVLVVVPAEEASLQEKAEGRVAVLQERFNQHLGYISEVVGSYASQTMTLEAADAESRALVEEVLQNTLPSAREAFLFARDQVQQPPDREFQLSFASIDLARQALRRDAPRMDAFRRDGQWLVQVAAPVRTDGDGEAHGALLVIFDADVFDPVMAATTDVLDGKVALLQMVDGQGQPVATRGQASGEALSRRLSIEGWSVAYTPGAVAAELFPRTLLWGVPLLVALLVIAVIWGVFMSLQKQLRSDFSALGKWAQKAFAGERARLPALRIGMLSALGDSLQRLAQAADKRVAKADAQAKESYRKARAAAVGSTGSTDKALDPLDEAAEMAAEESDDQQESAPLFEDDGALDIDMLDGDEDVLGLGTNEGEGMNLTELEPLAVDVPASIFRAYDIRGVVGETLTPDIVRVIGRAIGTEARHREQKEICVGYDGRHSGPELAEALMEGIMSAGMDVVDVGRVPTPVLYFAAHHLETGSGVMVTGSHNPPDYNGLKMVLGGETLAGDAIQGLLERINSHLLDEGQGQRTSADVRAAYLETILNDIAVAAPLKVVVDAGNGIAGELGPQLVQELGCEVIPLYCEVDGNFPNHHPDPGKPDNLKDLIDTVVREKADLGIAFDGDGDRLGVVTQSGKIIWPDRLLMLFARDVVSRNPGADIIYDVKCSRRLANVINEFGGRPVMWRTGHSWIKAKMKSSGALLAGEMSGHIFFTERWYGFDDGIYAAARLLEILGIEDRGADEIFAEFPEDYSTPEINVDVTDENKFGIIDALAKHADFGDANITDIDGLRVDYPDGWGLCRASNTTPMLVLRFEAETEEALERIKTVFREQMSKVQPELNLPF